MTDVLVVGEALVDIVVPRSGTPAEHVGGSPTNVAIGLARLGHTTRLATYVGHDERGRRILDVLAAEGVATGSDGVVAARTPTATAHLDETGQATYDFDMAWELRRDVSVPDNGHVHTGSIAGTLEPGGTQVEHLIRRARATATVSYDPNARPSLMLSPAAVCDRIGTLVALSDVAKASEEDVAWLYDDGGDLSAILRRWRAAGPPLAVLTRGAAGALVAIGEEIHEVRAPHVTVVDTVGAGDSFMSGLISGLLDAGLLGGPEARARLCAASWYDVRPALERAVACSAVTVTRHGADPPRRGDLPQL